MKMSFRAVLRKIIHPDDATEIDDRIDERERKLEKMRIELEMDVELESRRKAQEDRSPDGNGA